MGIAAGWYPDPLAADAVRWWTGEAWTESVERIPARPAPPGPSWVALTPVPQAPPLSAFSPTPVVQPYAAPAWAGGAVSGPYGRPAPPRSRPPWLLGMVVALVVVALVAAGVGLSVSRGGDAKVAAAQYLRALERGDTGAAYQYWCAADRAVYSEAVFRAQHEWRAGHAATVLSSFAPFGEKTSVTYRDDKGEQKDLPMEKSDGRWAVCPHGDRLKGDMANCGCMTPGQLLESSIAHLEAPDAARYPFVEVSCPTLPALVDGEPVVCTAAAADGRSWTVVATESQHASYTSVAITPDGTVG